MSFQDMFKSSILDQLQNQSNLNKTNIVMTLLIVSVFAIYILIVYKYLTKRSFYSPNFAKTLVGLAIVTTGIVLAMQVNVLVSLGMVGALSIVRFRNVVKDPLDLLFLFWSISVGIICGTGVFLIAVFTSVVLTVLLFSLDYLPNKVNSYILVVHTNTTMDECELKNILFDYCKKPMLRTKNCKKDSYDFLYEVKLKEYEHLLERIMKLEGVQNANLIAHDGEVRY